MADTSHNSVEPNGQTAADGAAQAPEPAGEAMLKMLTIQDLAELLRCSPRTIYRLVDVGRVPPPSHLRRRLDSAQDYDTLFDHYVSGLLPSRSEAVNRVSCLLAEQASVLLCMEADPALCHRTRLAEIISSMTHLPVRDIRGD